MFADQLRKYRKEIGLTQEELAARVERLTGNKCTPLNIGSYEKGTNPKLEVIYALAEALDIPEQLLFDDTKKKINKIVNKELPSYRSFNEHTKKVPLIGGYVGAGSSGIVDNIEIIDYLYVDNYAIKKYYVNDEIKALTVIGDSMNPYVDSGDIVLFKALEKGQYNLNDGKYIIETINGIMVKNLSFKTNGNIVISSENKAYSDEVIECNETQESLDIIGIVVGRILKS